MKAKKEKIKKPWSAKKLIFTFLLIGVVLGLALCGLILTSEMRFFEDSILNHNTHDYYCYDYNGDLNCYAPWYVETYDTALNYALETSWALCALYFAGAVGGCALIAGIILLVRGIEKTIKKTNETKREKTSITAEAVLDNVNFSFAHIENVEHLKMISASSTYGVGFFTAIAVWFCNIFGLECKMYGKKIEKAKSSAALQLMGKATAAGATGIMNVQFQITSTTVFMYGIAYK